MKPISSIVLLLLLVPIAQTTYACILCQLTLYTAEGYITISSTQQQITKIVEGICPYVPQNYQSACVDFINSYATIIIRDIVEREKPPQICSSLGYCPSDTTPGTTSSASLKSSNVEQCSICKKVHHAVNSSKIYPTRLDHLHKMALSHCAGSERCNSFVDNHIAQFATRLWSEQDPCAPSC